MHFRSSFFAVLALSVVALMSTTATVAQDIPPGGVIVFGGAGRAGVEIVKALQAKDETIVVFARATTDRTRLADLDVTVVEGDAMNAVDVNAAFAKAKPRVAINAMGNRGAPKGFWDITQMNITAAAKAAGTKEIIFLSSVGVGDSAGAYSAEALACSGPGLLDCGRAEEDMRASGLDYVIIRTGIIAREGTPATGKAELTEDRRVLKPVTRADLAALVVNCIGNPACRNRTFAAMDATLVIERRP